MNQFLRTVSLVVTTVWVGGLVWITYLHQTSTTIFLLGVAVAFIVLICQSRFPDLPVKTQMAT